MVAPCIATGVYMRNAGQSELTFALAGVLAEADFREREVVGKGYTGVGSPPEAFAAFIRADFEYKGRLIRVSGARAD